MVLYQKKILILCSIHKKWFVRENEMDIKELERQVGLSQMTIQLYENEKLLSPKEIGKNKKKSYTSDDIQRIKFIKYLRDQGFLLSEIKNIISNKSNIIWKNYKNIKR